MLYLQIFFENTFNLRGIFQKKQLLEDCGIQHRICNMSSSASSSSSRMPIALANLTLSEFAIGIADFGSAGILLRVARSQRFSDVAVGNLITACVLATVIGGQIQTIYLSRFEGKRMLIGSMLMAEERHAKANSSPNVSVNNV
ncbi:hypothetical protein [Comamonas sp. MYb21]|uniref:hypothetical protein n=1 Tax=Comamonas sp. MYb21 TaxID=1848648 RepID=UPI0030DDAAB0